MSNTLKISRTLLILSLIFILALILRFYYFPNDIYFGYDQARDAYTISEILMGNFKILGPPATFQGVHHGALFYYIFAPFYLLGKGDPTLVSAFLRVYNAIGVFLIYLISKKLFNTNVGLTSSFVYAISFEQTQYSLFLGHPSLAVITVLLFYLGLVLLIFEGKAKGLILVLLGLGLSVQFHFSMIFLVLTFGLIFLIFNKKIPELKLSVLAYSLMALLFSSLTYVISEIRFDFRMVRSFLGFLFNAGSGYFAGVNFSNLIYIPERYIHDNLLYWNKFLSIILILLAVTSLFLIFNNKYRKRVVFIIIWFSFGCVPYLFDHAILPIYYYGIGSSLALIILVSFTTLLGPKIFRLITVTFLILVTFSNLKLIKTINKNGTIPEINVQDKMLYNHEKEVLDSIYEAAQKQPFSVNALTNPYNVNTTWSYLFEFYGQKKYGYLPIWGGQTAKGFLGRMETVSSFTESPKSRFVIIEPSRGIPQHLINNFINEENIFSKIISEENFGDFILQSRVLIN